MLKTKTKAVVFDIGGVLIENPASDLLQYFADFFQLDQESFLAPYLEFFPLWEKGLISEKDFWIKILTKLDFSIEDDLCGGKLPLTQSLWYQGVIATFQPRAALLHVIAQLKQKGYHLALLSNTEEPTTWWFKNQGWEQLFHSRFYSCSIGMSKPSLDIYAQVERRLRMKPSKILFIDDKKENTDAARLRNWQTFTTTRENEIHLKLKELLQ